MAANISNLEGDRDSLLFGYSRNSAIVIASLPIAQAASAREIQCNRFDLMVCLRFKSVGLQHCEAQKYDAGLD
ncbi:hypothetical protein Q5Y75_18420, partial [Ruegeria sp. 2205SS24-7]|uniref:hypothetical protein n=1 Tax=Ruegeria discodermiae TaxID=3064389 RepID=UPI00274056FD